MIHLLLWLIAPQPEPLTKEITACLVINVDGFQTKQTIHPKYIELLKAHPFGGVIPHWDVADWHQLRDSVTQLQSQTPTRLLIGVDRQRVTSPLGGIAYDLGLGYGAGILGKRSTMPDCCFPKAVILDLLLQKALGLNLALGPTVDPSRRHGWLNRDAAEVIPEAQRVLTECRNLGLSATLKHFPYTPDSYNLHRQSLEDPLSLEQIQEKWAVFKALHPRVDFIMTTHLRVPVVSEQMVTFSPRWIHILRDDIGYQGLIISDALLMIRDYAEIQTQIRAHAEKQSGFRFHTVDGAFAYLALSAGHDLVILEGTAADTQQVIADLTALAQSSSPAGSSFGNTLAKANQRAKATTARNTKPDLHGKLPDSLIEQAFVLAAKIQSGNHGPGVCPHQTSFDQLQDLVARFLTK